MNRKEYLKKWREDNKEHIQNYKKEYAKTHDSSFKKLQDKYKQLQQENTKLRIEISAREEVCDRLEDNWNKLREYLFDIRKRGFTLQNLANVTKNTEPNIAILIIINKMQEIEGSDSNVKD